MTRCKVGLMALAGILGGLGGASAAHASLSGTATLTPQSLGGGQYAYSITIQNTGTTTIGTLWLAWVPGLDFMASSPTNISVPSGWVGFATHGGPGDGYGLEMYSLSSSTDIPAGTTLSGLSFHSADSPTALSGASASHGTYPALQSYLYIGSPFGDPGAPIVATVAPACAADFNGDGHVTVQDIFDFLTAWFANQPSADFNHSGSVTVQDIFDFLAAWFAGCH